MGKDRRTKVFLKGNITYVAMKFLEGVKHVESVKIDNTSSTSVISPESSQGSVKQVFKLTWLVAF